MNAPNMLWHITLSGAPSPALLLWGNRVVCPVRSPVQTETSMRLEVLHLADGHCVWQHTFDHALVSGLSTSGDHLLVSLTSTDLLRGEGALAAFNAAGEIVWRWAPGVQQISAPAMSADTVFVTVDATSLISGVPGATHFPKCVAPLPVSASRSAPTVADDILLIPCRAPHLLALALDGAPRWRFDAPGMAWVDQTPVIVGDCVFAVLSTGKVVALAKTDGAPVWQTDVGPAGKPLTAPVTDSERLYAGARDGLYALDLDGRVVWHLATDRRITAAPVVVGGVVYATCHDHHLYALDAVTGQELWRYAVKRHIEVSPLILMDDGRRPTADGNPTGRPSAVGGQAYAVIADAGGTVTALIRPRSAAEHEAAGEWQEAACAYAALNQPLRQAEALQHYARALSTAEMALEDQATLWEQIAALYAGHDQPALAEHCRREVARCLRQPDIALTIEHTGLALGEWSLVRFIVHNAGFGPARNLVVHTDREQFQGQVTQTQRITTLEAGAREVRTLDLKPLESGEVPLRVTVDFSDHAGQPLKCQQTIHLPVARERPPHAAQTRTQVFRVVPRFVDLEIRIFPRVNAGYPVEITLAGQQHFAGSIAEDLSTWIPSADTVADGRRLFAALTADPALANAWARCRGQAAQRRVRLWLDVGTSELHIVPWELLCENDLPLAADAATPFSRYLPTQEEWGTLVTTRPVRMLAAIANPTGLAEYNLAALDVAQEQTLLTAALGDVDDFQVDFLAAPVTLARLEKCLRSGYHLLHLVGHGIYSSHKQATALCLQDNAGQTQLVTDALFSAMLARQGIRPRLVVLATCHGARRTTADAWRGLAPALVQAGVPAVVAMQGAVAMSTAQAFTGAFYRALAEHGAVDLALNQARSLLISQQSPDAGLPVLLMRLPDGQIM